MPFLFTELDDSLRPRGSRDPLGIELLWSSVGRRLVGNLTTVTWHLDNFILTLVGFYLCGEQGEEAPHWPRFERFEQMTSRARVKLDRQGVLGIRRIQRSPGFPVPVGSSKNARILDNARQAGLWGLYSTALAASGLTQWDRRPTAEGAQVARAFVQGAPNEAWRLAADTRRQTLEEADMDAVQDWVRAVLNNQAARQQLAQRLLGGSGKSKEAQDEVFAQGWAFLKDRVADADPAARDFLVWLQARSAMLGGIAERILRFDEALALASVSFTWLLGCHGRTREQVAQGLERLSVWPVENLVVPDFTAEIADAEWRRRAKGVAAFCAAMAGRNWLGAAELLIEHHAAVAKGRGGAPWCHWEGDKLKVVMNASTGTLPGKQEIGGKQLASWMRGRSNGFFLGSFLSILKQSNAQPKVIA
jgi:hypothetical protein